LHILVFLNEISEICTNEESDITLNYTHTHTYICIYRNC